MIFTCVAERDLAGCSGAVNTALLATFPGADCTFTPGECIQQRGKDCGLQAAANALDALGGVALPTAQTTRG